MNRMLVASLRRHRAAAVALVLFAALLVVDQFWFDPTAARYARALKQATELGMPLDPNEVLSIMPPRLFALIADNSLPAAQAQDAANSGSLTAEFLGALTQRMSQRGITVVSTEPGPTTQDAHSIQVRAHVRMHGRYADIVMFLDDLAHDRLLFGVDRFSVMPETGSGVTVEMWASRLVLKAGAS